KFRYGSELRYQLSFLDVGQRDFDVLQSAALLARLHFLARCGQIQANGLVVYLCEPALPVTVARHRLEGLDLRQHAVEPAEVLHTVQLTIESGRGNLQG